MEARELTNQITNYVNSFNDKSVEFNKAMSNEHRTLQTNFTRLALAWIEYVASDEYRTDLRNEGCKKIASELLELFKEKKRAEGFTGTTLEMVSKPSKLLITL